MSGYEKDQIMCISVSIQKSMFRAESENFSQIKQRHLNLGPST